MNRSVISICCCCWATVSSSVKPIRISNEHIVDNLQVIITACSVKFQHPPPFFFLGRRYAGVSRCYVVEMLLECWQVLLADCSGGGGGVDSFSLVLVSVVQR